MSDSSEMEPMKNEVAAAIAEMRECLMLGMQSFNQVGKCVVRLVDEFGMSLEEVARQVAVEFVDPAVLEKFERIGRERLLPLLALRSWPAVRHLERLPLSEQALLLEEPVTLVVVKGEGEVDELQVLAKDLTPKQCQQVFDRDRVRSVGGQRAWLIESQNKERDKKVIRANPAKWRVTGGVLVVTEACTLTKDDVLAVLRQMK